MWKTKRFTTFTEMAAWIGKREQRIQYTQLFVNNAYAVEWRPLRRIG